jgi:acetyl-CoA carboxylase biotin carboxyl carrier protein
MKLTNEDVEEILRLLDDAGYDELHVETDTFSLSLSRTGEGDWVQQRAVTREPVIDRPDPAVQPDPAAGAPASTGSPVDAISQPTDSCDTDLANTGLAEVRAPLPGTFFRAARPGAAPFVEIGAPVEPATVVAIVEMMKLMNSVHAGVAGVIEQIGVGDAQPVAQGAVLMRIRPTPP